MARADGAAPLAKLRLAVTLLLVVIVVEGILGAQVREMTDELAKFHLNAPRSTWIGELEESWIYLFHRSFSWVVFGCTMWAWWLTCKHREGGTGWVERTVLGIVLAQMVLGVVMSQIHIYSWVQVLHVGLAAVLADPRLAVAVRSAEMLDPDASTPEFALKDGKFGAFED